MIWVLKLLCSSITVNESSFSCRVKSVICIIYHKQDRWDNSIWVTNLTEENICTKRLEMPLRVQFFFNCKRVKSNYKRQFQTIDTFSQLQESIMHYQTNWYFMSQSWLIYTLSHLVYILSNRLPISTVACLGNQFNF